MSNDVENDLLSISGDDYASSPSSVNESVILLTSDDSESEPEVMEQNEIRSPPTKKLKLEENELPKTPIQPGTTFSACSCTYLPGQIAGNRISRMSTAGSPRISGIARSFGDMKLFAQQQRHIPVVDCCEDDDDSRSDTSSSPSAHSSIFDTTGSTQPGPEIEGEFVDRYNKGIECYDLYEDDEEDENYKNLTNDDMYCEICDRRFKMTGKFRFHHRRHQFVDHFKCPSCSMGFTTLKLCVSHEESEHGLKCKGGDLDLTQNGDRSTSTTISISSTCLQPYRGPPVLASKDAFDIEEKYAKGRLVAKQIEKERKLQ